ncbi:thioredoxin family protein [Pseudomonas silvicola]|nr:thioredoxin family protein [Pseudomonas silvicola]
MSGYRELFEKGMGFAAFVATGLDAEQEGVVRAGQNLAAAGLSKVTRQRLATLVGDYYLLVAGEMWCPDCQVNLVALDALCAAQPRVRLAVISKARAEQQLRERLGLTKVSIPLVVVLDAGFEPVGLFVERPQVVIQGDEQTLAAYKAAQLLEATVTDVLALMERAEKSR